LSSLPASVITAPAQECLRQESRRHLVMENVQLARTGGRRVFSQQSASRTDPILGRRRNGVRSPVPQSRRSLRNTHRRAFGIRREYTPATVALAKKIDRKRACRLRRFNAYVTPPIQACATASCYPNRHCRSHQKPFLHHEPQRPFKFFHRLLLQSRSADAAGRVPFTTMQVYPRSSVPLRDS
jgi:hypothetical protein